MESISAWHLQNAELPNKCTTSFLTSCRIFSRQMQRPMSLTDFTVYDFVLEKMAAFAGGFEKKC